MNITIILLIIIVLILWNINYNKDKNNDSNCGCEDYNNINNDYEIYEHNDTESNPDLRGLVNNINLNNISEFGGYKPFLDVHLNDNNLDANVTNYHNYSSYRIRPIKGKYN